MEFATLTVHVAYLEVSAEERAVMVAVPGLLAHSRPEEYPTETTFVLLEVKVTPWFAL